jgi:hypothetical protein
VNEHGFYTDNPQQVDDIFHITPDQKYLVIIIRIPLVLKQNNNVPI